MFSRFHKWAPSCSASAAVLAAILITILDGTLAVRGPAGGHTLHLALSTRPGAEQQISDPLLRLRGGWCRTMTKQRARKIPRNTQVQKQNLAATTTRRPCSGSYKISGVERYHGPDVVRMALWGSSPRDIYHDPRTAARRLGLRMSKMDTNMPFNEIQPPDVNLALLKVCHRGLEHLVPSLVEAGADIDYLALRHTGAPMELVGLTPLAAASHQGHTSTVKTLLTLGANAVIADGDDREAAEGNAVSKAKIARSEELWIEISKMVAAKRRATKQAEHAKVIPYVGNNRRTPGKRKTRHAKGARGACH